MTFTTAQTKYPSADADSLVECRGSIELCSLKSFVERTSVNISGWEEVENELGELFLRNMQTGVVIDDPRNQPSAVMAIRVVAQRTSDGAVALLHTTKQSLTTQEEQQAYNAEVCDDYCGDYYDNEEAPARLSFQVVQTIAEQRRDERKELWTIASKPFIGANHMANNNDSEDNRTEMERLCPDGILHFSLNTMIQSYDHQEARTCCEPGRTTISETPQTAAQIAMRLGNARWVQPN